MQNQEKAVAVMQPYIFPYIGYFQLINAVDVFVFYDDVNFIKQGWINRNKILSNNEAQLFTVPLKKISSFKQINEVEVNASLYLKWKKKFLKSLEQNYTKAPYFKSTYELIKKSLDGGENKTISELASLSIENVAHHLGIKTKFNVSSVKYANSKESDRTDRLLHISKELGATKYINALGGQELYNKNDFLKHRIDLKFLKPELKPYSQFSNDFVAGLSIIDILMFNSKEEAKVLIEDYVLL